MVTGLSRSAIRISYKRDIVILVLFLLSQLMAAPQAHPMSVPPMSKKEEGSFITSYKEGGTRWKATWTLDEFIESGESKVRLVLNAQGLTNPYTRDMKWESVSVWKSGAAFTPVQAVTEVRDMQGNLVMTERKAVDDSAGTVTFVREDHENNGSVNESFETERDLMIVEGIVLALRSLPFGTDDTVKAQFLTNEPDLYNVEFKQKGRETINTPGGEVECYKVELVPKLGALNVFKVFFPKTYFWFTVAPPHKWVRYEGLENDRDSPEVVMEAVPVKKSGN